MLLLSLQAKIPPTASVLPTSGKDNAKTVKLGDDEGNFPAQPRCP